MRMATMACVAVLAVSAMACDNSDSGPDVNTACSNVMTFCPTGYSWSLYVTSLDNCSQVFKCVTNLYTGSCRSSVEEGVNCLAGVTDAGGCTACDTIFQGVQSSCPEPAACFH